MNLRRVISWCHRRLVTLAEAGALHVRIGPKRYVKVYDEADVDAWLLGEEPPSLARARDALRDEYLAAGVDIR